MAHVEVLDFDALVRKHVRILPTYRSFQMISWIPLVLVLSLLLGFIVFLIYDLVTAGLRTDFLFSLFFIQRKVPDQFLNWWSLATLALWPVAVFATLSLISFQLDRLARAAFSLLALWYIVRPVSKLVNDSLKWQGGLDENLGSIVSDVWLIGVLALFAPVVVLTVSQMYALSAHERSILREGGTETRLFGSTFLHAFGIPPNIKNSTRRVRTALLAFLSNLIGFGPPFFLLNAGGAIFLLVIAAAPAFWAPVASSFFFPNLIYSIRWFALMLFFLVLIVIVFRLVGNVSRRMSRRFMRVSLEQAQAADQRRPVVFLRSFRDDAVALAAPPSGLFYKLFGYADRNKTLDQLVLEEGTTYGPVVALGNPSDPVPPYGAARGYAKHSGWQKMVSELMDASAAIVICVDETPSLWWEIEHVSRNAHLAKTLLLLHPRYGTEDTSEIIGKIEQAFGLSLSGAGLDRGKTFGLWLDPMMGLRAGVASRFSRAHYLLMLRWFLRSRVKVEKEEHRAAVLATRVREPASLGRLAVFAGIIVIALLGYSAEQSTTTNGQAPASSPLLSTTTTAQAPASSPTPDEVKAKAQTIPLRADSISGDDVKLTQVALGCPSEDTFTRMLQLKPDADAAAKLALRENCRVLNAGTIGIVVERRPVVSLMCMQLEGRHCLWVSSGSLTITKGFNQK
jgi:hypothetical protein